jgi:protein-L-isoaspartate(D-aspartate) O-methyltransferase
VTIASIDTLVNELDSAESLPAGFGRLLHAVPRELFIPDRIWIDRNPLDRASQPDQWMRVVYSNSAIVTQFDDGRTEWPNVGKIPTCSASMPSTVAGMLDHLDVKRGHSVLEIGTGTGFNAALLSAIVGASGSVTTVEIDKELAKTARDQLTLAGFDRVHTVLGDATTDTFESAPFDCIISTASVHLGRIPYSWVQQTKPGGIIVTPVRADLTSGPLVRFIVNEDGTATGRIVPMGVEFMEVRSQRTAGTPNDNFNWQDSTADQGTAKIKPWLMFSDIVSRWALAVALPSCRYNMEENKFIWLRDPVSYSWASVVRDNDGRLVVRQKGIRRLWDEAENAYRWWINQGKPVGPDWIWTITPEHQTIQLDAAPGTYLTKTRLTGARTREA